MKKVILCSITAMLIMALMVTTVFAEFTDISGHWAEGVINEWDSVLLSGYEDGTFRPDSYITRAEFTKIIMKMNETNLANNPPPIQGEPIEFSDVNPDDWYYDYVRSAVVDGYINGYEDGTFRPGNRITREEAVTILSRFMGIQDDGATDALAILTDSESISEYAKGYLNENIKRHYLYGYEDNTIRPRNNIKRGEAVQYLDNVISGGTNPRPTPRPTPEPATPSPTPSPSPAPTPDSGIRILGTYKTQFDTSNVGRSTNIALAAASINGTVLQPGQTFSFLKTIGRTTPERGYMEGGAISGDEIIQVYGGGICQVSSTIYASVLRANLQVVERYNHSLIVGYLPLGQDATVSEGAADFRFKNNTSAPLKIIATTSNGTLQISLEGINPYPSRTYEIVRQDVSKTDYKTIETKDSTLPVGQRVVKIPGATGYVVDTFKKTYENGVLIKTELVSRSTYRKVDAQVLVGTRK